MAAVAGEEVGGLFDKGFNPGPELRVPHRILRANHPSPHEGEVWKDVEVVDVVDGLIWRVATPPIGCTFSAQLVHGLEIVEHPSFVAMELGELFRKDEATRVVAGTEPGVVVLALGDLRAAREPFLNVGPLRRREL